MKKLLIITCRKNNDDPDNEYGGDWEYPVPDGGDYGEEEVVG